MMQLKLSDKTLLHFSNTKGLASELTTVRSVLMASFTPAGLRPVLQKFKDTWKS